MRIALVTESSQKEKNELYENILKKIALKYGHTIYNYGVRPSDALDMNYVSCGVLGAILLNSHAVDFVISGCKTGQGVMITLNSFPNVTCGLVSSSVDALLFQKINAGNAVSIPFGYFEGIGSLFEIEEIFRTLLSTEPKTGYPTSRKEIQEIHRQNIYDLKLKICKPFISILDEMDKDILKEAVYSPYFEEMFFQMCDDYEIEQYLKDFLDSISSY